MVRCRSAALVCSSLFAALAAAQTVDGTRDPGYCTPLVVQNTQTQFGNGNLGQVGTCNGSELDNLSARIVAGTLYMHIGGNLESNFNKVEIFFDTIPAAGQNRLRGDNANVDFNGLNRMGDEGTGNGLTFDAGFEPDYWIGATGGGGVYTMFTNWAELLTAGGGLGDYLGSTAAASDGTLIGGNNPNNIRITINNSNTAGVIGGVGTVGGGENPAEVVTGLELAVPLAAIGNPTGDIRVCIFVNGSGHDFLSNQVLGGIGGGGNLGEPRLVNFGNIVGDQFVTIPAVASLCGACCINPLTCVVTSESDCETNLGGTYLGDNLSCAGNPCDSIATGACCRGQACTVEPQSSCEADGGYYFGDGSNCDAAPCLTIGACCNATTCTIATENGCLEGGGIYIGGGTSCATAPCAVGRCCLVNGQCDTVREEVCEELSGFYAGDNTACDASCNIGRCCIGTHCVTVSSAQCAGLGGTYSGDFTDCIGTQCGAPLTQPRIDGFLDDVLAGVVYGGPRVVQDTLTQFGDSGLGLQDAANGSELDAAYGVVAGDNLYLLLTGNLETNSNQLEIFFDTKPGGQNQLRGDNADIDFNGLNRMGDDPNTVEIEGLMFDEYDNGQAIVPFEADYWVTVSNSRPALNLPVEMYVLYADIPTGGGGTGYYLGEGRCANQTQGGLLNRDPNGNNPFGALATLDNSNVAGVYLGTAPDLDGLGASVNTGFELCIPLSALGPPTGDIKICAFINGQQHDFVSNQVLRGVFGDNGDNLGNPRFVNFKAATNVGAQLFIVPFAGGCPGERGDANCDGNVDFFDIDPFLLALFNLPQYQIDFCGSAICTVDIDCSANVDFFDIDPFLECLFNVCAPCNP